MRTIAAKWADFEKTVVPATAPPVQRTEMRRSFYAGAISVLNITTELGEDHISEEAGAAILDGLCDEARMYEDDLRAGRA
jgi:hypothetical protein